MSERLMLAVASLSPGGRQARRFLIGLLILCLGLATNSIASWAQSTDTGMVVGSVTDPSGAVVPKAKVTLRGTTTGVVRTTETTDTGRFVFVNIPPGTYDVTVRQTGFAEARVSQQVVSVGRQLTLNIPLKLGAATQEVVVQASNTDLQTLNATIGNTVTSAALQNLPSLGRDVSTFATLQPGVSPDGSVAGTVSDQANFMLDGGNNSNDMDGSGGIYNPSFAEDPTGGVLSNPNSQIGGAGGIVGFQPSGVMPTPVDSVEEFKVATTNQTADFNNSSGMQVQIVTKRGTNSWHGTVYEYYLDNNFSANTWENKQSGTPVPNWHRSWFGAAAGGPLIPKDILGGKTYIFGNYQGSRWPNSETIDRLVPSADMRNGILHSGTTTYDLNAMDPRGIGINTLVQQMWNNHMPLPTPGAGCGPFDKEFCDGVNTLDFRANVAIPQSDNFGVLRVDHDFGSKWHFMSSYRYYHLTRATDQQIDIGGFFPGNTLGHPASLTNRPQVPWYLVLGMTTNISAHVTNDFRYSFLRNFWQWGSAGDPPQFSQLGGALEPFGEQATEVLAPYNVNTQQTRTRFWNGKDHFFRDDVSMLKGSHLLQFGGQWQHNWDYHQRSDNGGGINFYPVYQLGDSSGSGNVDLSALVGSSSTLQREAAAVLGIVTDSQQAYTRSGPTLALNPPLTPAFDKSTINYYNVYFNDSWHLKPSLTLSYGLGYTLEMPPTEQDGKQIVFVDQSGLPVDTAAYLKQRQTAALNGQVFNPQVGFALVGNTAGGLKYPYQPFYGGFSPRIAVAWNPELWGSKNTVFRGGYGRIYGRLNGVDQVLVPLLGTGLIQAVQCRSLVATNPGIPGSGGTCNPAASLTANNAFRIGTDGNVAPIPPASPTLPQPLYPGINDVSTAAPEGIDPHFRPNSVDSFDFSIQHQFSSKMSVEVGLISRWIHNEYQPINLNAVPYMMRLGGQQFQAAYAAIEKAMGCATSQAACQSATPASTLAMLAAQPFFETALAGTGYCTSGNCTATLVNDATAFGLLQTQSVWDLWSYLDKGRFNFPRSMMNTPDLNTPICPDGTPCGSAGLITSGVAMNTSLGHGNYNAAFVSFKMNDWHGVTMQHNFTFSKALGTGAFTQATSEQTVVDPFDLNRDYGLQPFDRKFVYSMFMVYQPPFYRGQQGLVGHLLGGWTFAPIFTAGSGAPLPCNNNTGFFFEAYSGAQEFGSADGNNFATDANCAVTSNPGKSSAHLQPDGTVNLFANPTTVLDSLRPAILGIDNRSGGIGVFRGMPYWNVNLGIKKNVRITERFNAEASFNFINVLNHNQLLDPILSITDSPSSFGQITVQGSTPRTMEFGIRVNF